MWNWYGSEIKILVKNDEYSEIFISIRGHDTSIFHNEMFLRHFITTQKKSLLNAYRLFYSASLTRKKDKNNFFECYERHHHHHLLL